MTIDWNAFSPWSALAGGVLIGIAASMLVLLAGRIAGVSGILGGLLTAPWRRAGGDTAWRLAFLGGLIAAPVIGEAFAPMPLPRIDASFGLVALSGLVVGLGTRFAGGCTSGHGVCGVSRFSSRSVIATVVFMAAGVATVHVTRHVMAN